MNMKVGVFSFNTEHTLRADRLAVAAEARGFESLWFPEHSHIPVPAQDGDPATGMPRQPDGRFLPEVYRHMADPLTSIAAAAAASRALLLGTCVCLINQHHPLNLAKQAATLDRLSDGRFLLGIGAGWNATEMAHHGVQFADRWRQLQERLQAMRALWAGDRAGFAGEFVNFAESWQYPKPLDAAGPPVLLGSLDTPFGRERVARLGDGWLPLTFDMARTRRSIEDVHERMRRHGRNPQALSVSLFFLAGHLPTPEDLDMARELGVTRVILRLPPADESQVLRRLDEFAETMS